jgi:hypothetical protein
LRAVCDQAGRQLNLLTAQVSQTVETASGSSLVKVGRRMDEIARELAPTRATSRSDDVHWRA